MIRTQTRSLIVAAAIAVLLSACGDPPQVFEYLVGHAGGPNDSVDEVGRASKFGEVVDHPLHGLLIRQGVRLVPLNPVLAFPQNDQRRLALVNGGVWHDWDDGSFTVNYLLSEPGECPRRLSAFRVLERGGVWGAQGPCDAAGFWAGLSGVTRSGTWYEGQEEFRATGDNLWDGRIPEDLGRDGARHLVSVLEGGEAHLRGGYIAENPGFLTAFGTMGGTHRPNIENCVHRGGECAFTREEAVVQAVRYDEASDAYLTTGVLTLRGHVFHVARVNGAFNGWELADLPPSTADDSFSIASGKVGDLRVDWAPVVAAEEGVQWSRRLMATVSAHDHARLVAFNGDVRLYGLLDLSRELQQLPMAEAPDRTTHITRASLAPHGGVILVEREDRVTGTTVGGVYAVCAAGVVDGVSQTAFRDYVQYELCNPQRLRTLDPRALDTPRVLLAR